MSGGIDPERLASQLVECAILVKKGDRHNSLLRKTADHLSAFLGGKFVLPHENSNGAHRSNHNSQNAVSKPHKPPHAMGILGKMVGMGGEVTHEGSKTAAQREATSRKNADRAKADLQGSNSSGWFGSSSDDHQHGGHDTATATASASSDAGDAPKKPEFQRPANPKSSLIANGWIEQQRRSKMRTVWKDVL